MNKSIFTILLVIILATSCNKASSPQTLSFEVLVQSSPFTETSPPSQDIPNLMVIASPKEISPPLPKVEFSDTMLAQLKEIDYDRLKSAASRVVSTAVDKAGFNRSAVFAPMQSRNYSMICPFMKHC